MEVNIGPCRCTGTHHGDGDLVVLRDTLSTKAGLAASATYREGDASVEEATARGHDRVIAYIAHSVESWNLEETVDDEVVPVPPTPENVRRLVLDDWTRGALLVPVAVDLYEEAWALPLVVLSQNSSASGDGSISPNRSTRRSRRKR